MNNSYKLVYSEALNTWVAVAEHVSARGKKSAVRLVTAAALLAGGAVGSGWALAAPPLITPPAVNQLPTGGQVAAGTVNISKTQTATAANMAIQQSSNQAIVNWQSFNVGANAKVNITQPSNTSVLLNRVMDSNPSQIFGQVNANGQVFLSNPNGVYFAPGSSVDVGSFTATTHSISDADFLAGKYNFNRNGATGSITNEGSITSGLGGYIALLAPEVRNQGVVVAKVGGTVAMAAGESYQLQFNSNSQLTNVLVTPSTVDTLIENGNAVQAPGGLIIMSAQAASSLLGGVVKNSGSISATGLVNDGGTIRLTASNKIELTSTSTISADAAPNSAGNGGRIDIITDLSNATGSTQVDGTISAKGGEQGGDGGFVDTSAAMLAIGENTLVTTGAAMGNAGTWLLDPYDVTIAGPAGTASGTAYSDNFAAGANSTILASSISNALNAGSNVTVSTGSASSNTIFVNSAIAATTGSASLTLTGGTINLAADITTKGSQTYNGAVVINNASGINLSSTNSNVNFGSTVNSATGNYYGLTVSNGTGTTSFGGVVGGTNALSYLCINAASCTATSAGTASGNGSTTLAGDVTTSGTQAYGGNLTLGANTSLTSTANGGNGAVTIAGAVNSTSVSSLETGIIEFLGSGYWGVSTTNGSSWAFYESGSSSNTYQSSISIGSASYTSTLAQLGTVPSILYSSGNYSWNPATTATVSYLVVGGGGGGSSGGGGGGGVLQSTSLSVSSAVTYTITVGAGGAGSSNIGTLNGTNGGNSSITGSGLTSVIAYGGGGGSRGAFQNVTSGSDGSSGGGGGSQSTPASPGGAAIYGSQGFAGGAANNPSFTAGGGGGAGSVGGAGTSTSGGSGGSGVLGNITTSLSATTSNYFGGGGGGGTYYQSSGASIQGTGGSGGGASSGKTTTNPGITNSGGGGGGYCFSPCSGSGGSGGSGIVALSGSLLSSFTQNVYSLTINSGTGKSSIGGSVSNASTLTINSTSSLSEITGAIGGSTALSKSGAGGALTLSGANTYTGGTTISAGTLKIGNATALGGSGGAVSVTDGAALDLNGTTMTNTNTLTLNGSGISGGGALTNSSSTAGTYVGNIVLGSATSIGSAVGNITASGEISGAYTLTKVAAAALTLTGSNTYTGGTTISAGTLQIGSGSTSGRITGDVANSGNLTFNRSDAMTYAGGISGAGALTKLGTGALTLSGTNTYSGTTSISAGTLKAANASALGTGAVSIGAVGTLDLTFSGTVALGSSLSMSTGAAITNSANTSSLSVAGASTLLGTINTAGNQTYSGAVTISANTTLTTLNTSSVNTNGAITFGSTVDSLAGNNYGLTVNNGTGTTSIASAVGASNSIGALALNGTGAITLNGNVTTAGNQTYAGPVTTAAGVQLTANDGLGTMGMVTNGNNNDSYYAFGVPSTANLQEYQVAAGTSSADVTSASNDKLGVLFYNNTGTLNGTTSGSWCCYNYPVLVNAGKSNYLSSISVVSRQNDNIAARIPTYVVVYGSNTPFTSSYTYRNWNDASLSNVSILGTGYQQSNFTELGRGALTITRDNNANLSNTISLNNSSAYQYFQIVFTSSGGISSGVAPNLGGSLALNSINLFGQGVSNAVTFNQAVTANGALTVNAGSLSATSISAAGSLLINSRNDSTITGSISDGSSAASLSKTGTGTLTLSGANTFTGGTTISAGTLRVGAGSTTGTLSGAVINSGALVFNRSDAISVSSDISGTGSVTQSGTGTTSLTGSNTYAGGTTITAGTLQIGAGSNTGSINGNVTNNGTLAFNRSDDLTFSGVISGTGSLTKTATGTITLTGTNLYTGATTVSAGTLAVANVAGLGDVSAGTTVASGATLDLQGVSLGAEALTLNGGTLSTSTGASSLSGTVSLSANSTASVAGTQLSLSGVVSGGSSLTKTGSGTLVLSGANTYTGATTITSGTLAITHATGLGTTAGGVTVASGATLDLQGAVVGTEAIALNGGTLATSTGTSSLSGAVTLGADSTINVAGSASQLTISGLVTGASKALTKSGTGNLILTARNTFSGGMTIAAGTATEGTTYDGTSGPFGSGTVYVPTGGTLDTNAYNIAVLVSLGGGSLVNNSTVVQNGAGDISAGVTLTANSIFGGVGKLNAWTQIQSNGYGLAFVGSGYKNLSNTSNTLTSIASGAGVGQIDVTNNQNLTIGSVTVGSTPYTGLSSTGTILVKTITGNLTVNNNVVTSSTSSNASSPAIELAAGYSDATTSTTNNLILASSASSLITAGSGAAIALYSGTPTSSSYLSEFATGQTTKSITYSKTTSNRPSAIAGYYVMYRGSQPNLYVIYSSSGSSTYGSAPNVTYTFNTLADGSGNSYISTDTSTLSVTGTALFKGTYAPTGTTNVSLNASANAGNYTAVTYLSGLSSPIYTLTAGTGTGTFTINKANAYVIVTTGQSSTYGTSPTLSYSFNTSSAGTGTPISASPAGLSGSALITNAPTATSDAGTYSLSYASGLSSTNYEFNGAASATPYTVNQAQAFVIINAGQFSTYGSVPSIGYTFNTNSAGTGSSIDASPAGLSGTATITNAPTSTSNAGGTYNITYASGLTSTNYAFFGAASPRSYTVNKAPLNLAISKVYDGTTSLTNANTYTFSGTRYNGDAAPTITSGSASTLSANAATYTSFSTNSFVLSNNNYTLTGGTVAATIDPKTVSVTNAARSTTYNGVTNYNTLANGASYSVGTMVGSDSVASVTQTPSGFIGSATGTAQAGTLTVTPSAAVLGTGTASNYTFSYVPSTHTVEKANLSVSATPSLTGNVYNGNAFTGTYTTTAVNGETFTVTGQATGTNAGTYTSALNVSGAALANYNTPAISNANLVISPKPVTLTNTSRSTTYDGVSNYTTLANGTSYGVGTMVGSDSVASVTQTPSGFIGSATGTAQAGTLTVTPSAAVLGTGTASNYTFSYVPSTHTVDKANLSISATPNLTGNVYNGSAFTGTYTTTAVNGETFTVTGQATGTNAGTYTSALNVSGAALANYNTPVISNANLVISRKPASIANVARSTPYDGLSTNNDLANGMTYTVSGLVGFDAVSSVTQTPGNSVLASSMANAGSFTVTPSAAVMSTGLVSNYEFSYGSALASVSKVNLSVIANNGGKFVGESDNSAYDGVSYRGFVAGETASVLSGAVVISRSNASVNAPGTYTGVLSAVSSTLSSNNYNISYEAGSYTIVPADQLLIRLTNTTTSYGTAPSYTLSSVQYKSSAANAVVDLTSRAAVNSSAFTLSDGAGGSTSLTLGPLSSILSSAGQVAVGSYQVGAASITNTSANYSNTVNIVGSLTVDPKSVTATASAGLGKTYDGTTTMGGLGLGLNGLVGADAVSATGLGTYANANAGNNKSFAVTGIQLAGTDASNYKLASNTLSASTGVITQASLLIKAKNDSKSYDASAYSSANAAAAGVNYSGFVNGETASALGGSLTFGGTAIGAVNVGNYVIEPNGLTSNNYAITYGNGALNISPANVSVSATNVSLTGTVSKVYDGTNVATLAPSNYVMTGWQGSDGATIAQTVGTYDNANAGSNKLVNVTLTSNDYTAINGTLLSNYNLPTAVSGYVGLVVPKLVTVANAARTTTYDGVTNYNTLASGTTFTVSAMVGSDTLSSVTQTPTGFGSSASGTAQGGTFTVTPSAAVLSTGAVSNYSFSFVSSTHSVDRVNLSVTANNATKTYDGVVYAGGNGVSYNGFVNNETSAVLGGTLGYAGSSQNAKNVGNYVITPNGLTSSNYTMSFVDGSLTITPAGLNAIVASLTGSTSKVYDGNTAATLTPGNFAFSGFATGEGASVSKTTGTFDNANAGNNKTVTVSLSSSDMAANSGTLLSNYTLPTSASGAIGTITPANLILTALTNTKNFDGKTDAQAIPTVSGLKGSDTVSNLSEAYADANPGTGKTLNVQTGYQISDGNQGRNYSVTLVPNQTGEIRAQAVAVLPPVAPSASISSYSPPTLTLYAASGSAASASSASSSSGASSSVSVGSSSGVVVNTINSPTTQVTGLVAVLVPAGTATTGTGLVIALPEQVLTSAGPNSSVQVTLPNNEPLPSWIRYDAATQTLVTTAVPSGGFPLSVVVTVGGQSTIIQISETKNNP